LLVAVAGDGHWAFEVMMHHTESLFAKAALAKVPVFPTCSIPFLNHWYDGETPPFAGTAVKVADVPEQMVVCVELIVTEGTTVGVTVITTLLLVAVAGNTQVLLEVTMHHTESLLARVLVV
jgi:hypothetical protein